MSFNKSTRNFLRKNVCAVTYGLLAYLAVADLAFSFGGDYRGVPRGHALPSIQL